MWHWIACGYWKISVYEGLCDGDFYECVDYWAPTTDLLQLGFQTQYTQSFFWAVVVTTGIGRDIIPRTNNETGFTVIVIMVGVVMYALVIGAVGRSLAELDSTNTAFRKKLKELNSYMRYQNVPDYLQKTVLDYYDYLFESRNAVDHSVLEELPDSIQVRLSVAQNRGLIQKVPLFADCSTACVIRLVQKLVPIIALPGEFIIVEGEEGSEMFLVYKGSVEVVLCRSPEKSRQEETVLVTLEDGSFFGENALLTEETRMASVRARSYCDLMSLEKVDLDRVTSDYPEFTNKMRRIASERRSKTLLFNAKAKWKTAMAKVKANNQFIKIIKEIGVSFEEANSMRRKSIDTGSQFRPEQLVEC
jgi:voltage-gated potassium channel